MRPVRLDLAGFTVFKDETTIDFTNADFFALVGPTGSGKSTILDAICFALYGTVPRWGDRRAIANALAPSAAEARVRLVFESAGLRYVASRVIRRDGKGRVSTTHAGLELLPQGFDLSRLDTGLTAEDLGEVLAGTPNEMDAAVQQAVGLPYEQFTSCVVLPQGEFAEFLHAKPATRQQILVNLLGLSVYERIRDAATAFAAKADTQLETTDKVLATYADATEDALAAAADKVTKTETLVIQVSALVPQLSATQATAADARKALALLDSEVGMLGAVRPPADAAATAAAVADARKALRDATAAVVAAEEREDKLRDQVAAGADATALYRLLDAYAQQTKHLAELTTLGAAVAAAEAGLADAQASRAKANAEVELLTEALVAAQAREQEAQTADRAATLRPHLVKGKPCPVCTQTVTELPSAPHSPAYAAARTAVAEAKAKLQKATEAVKPHDAACRDLETTLARAKGYHDNLTSMLAAAAKTLAASPGEEAVQRELAALVAQQRELEAAGAEVQAARAKQRHAAQTLVAAEQHETKAWRGFDGARDAVAALQPPPALRESLAEAWAALATWAADSAQARLAARESAATAVAAADEAVTSVQGQIADHFAAAGIPSGTASAAGPTSAADPASSAAVALSQATERHAQIVKRRTDLAALQEQRTDYERDKRLGTALAQHLRANNFERWLLAEALDALVDGASRTLRELSGGQYELVHEKGEFSVVDHHDASLRRAVRTLSGGETFQASLALALALSEQLAGLSTSAASLESILLDEGFGTLDAGTLDTVAATLENLASQGDRMVGVVTHVAALAERIPVRFTVNKNARTATVERIDP